jgi:hypothetical protein
VDQVRSATAKLGAGGKWIVVGEILATHKLRNRLSSFYLLSNKNVTHDVFPIITLFVLVRSGICRVTLFCGADVPKLLERRNGYICI